MGKKYRRKTSRSRRNTPRELNGRVTVNGGVHGRQVQLMLPIPELLSNTQDALEALVKQAGLLLIKGLLDEEVEQLAGKRYEHQDDRSVVRWGDEEGHIVLGGRKLAIKRPRVREVDGSEIPLARYQLFRAGERMKGAVERCIVRGVSTRNYEGLIDGICDGYGVRRSSVSRHWKAASAKDLERLLHFPLVDLDIPVIMIDGVGFHEHLLVVALGVLADGRKRVLGLWQGATENAQLCKDLLADLVDRGLAVDRRRLFVLDGAKALHKAVKSTFGSNALIQRCTVHKLRNVQSYLPEEYHVGVAQRLHAAWGMKDYREAKKLLQKTVKYLEGISASAAASLEEGLEETLTLHLLDVPDILRKTLRSTNAIESCFSRTRELCKNVKRWRDGAMAERWAGTMLLVAQKSFRRIKGFREMQTLLSALRHSRKVKELAA